MAAYDQAAELAAVMDYEDEYTVDENGIIRNPSRFEGEMAYVPFYWEIYLNGGADRDDGRVLGFNVTAEDKLRFPELRRRRTVKLHQSDSGFIYEVR